MTFREGKIVGDNAMDVIAIAEERYPGCRLVSVKTTLTIRRADGGERVVSAVKEKRP